MNKKSFLFISAITIFALFIFSPSQGQDAKKINITVPQDVELRIDSLFSSWDTITSPGAAIAVMHKGEIVFSKGYGSAQLEYDIPITPTTIFHIASVSKQFTVFSILLLQEEGKLFIDDDIRKHIPEVPDFGKKISLKHLMTHTSGMRDQWNLLALAGWRLDDVITKEHVMTLVRNQKELNFDPGEEYVYCNTGFTLLAEVVARVSGKSFAAFTEERIFGPLNMQNTLFYDDHEKIVKNRAYSYQRTDDGFQKSVLSYANAGATSLFTTVEDLMLWTDNFIRPKVGNQHIFKQMNIEAVLNDGSTFGGGMGQFINTYKGLKQIQHGGADAGYRSYLGRFPEQDFAVAVFSNLGAFNPTGLSLKVADLFLSELQTKEEVTVKKDAAEDVEFVELSNEQLNKHEGTYWNDAGSYSRTIYVRDDTLWYDRGFNRKSPLAPLSEHEFKMLNVDVDLRVSFKNENGNRKMNVTIDGGDPIVSDAYLEPVYTNASLQEFAGNYISSELNTNYRLAVKGDTLISTHFRHGEMILQPVKTDFFETDKWYFGYVRFERNDAGEVSGCRVSSGRVRNLLFVKE
jgi:CubicO group peptidase (beta-lactamase class C family)